MLSYYSSLSAEVYDLDKPIGKSFGDVEFYRERIVDALIATSPAFGLLDAQKRRTLLSKFVPRRFKPGEIVIREGDRTSEIYIVREGTASAYRGSGPTAIQLDEIKSGTILGEIAGIMGIPRTATIVAGQGFEALQLDGAAFCQLLSDSPELERKLRQVANRRVSSYPGKPAPNPYPGR